MDKKILIIIGIIILLGAAYVFWPGGTDESPGTPVGLVHVELEEMPTNVREYLEQFTMTENYKAFHFDGDTYLFAARGEMRTEGYRVVLRDALYNDGKITVTVEKRDPSASEMVAQVLTYPSKLVKLSDQTLEYRSVIFVDEENKELATSDIIDIIRIPETIADLYFGTEEGLFRKERRIFPADITPENGYLLIEALIEGPEDTETYLPVLPEGTTILNYRYDRDQQLVTIDLGGDITSVSGSMGEVFAVYGIVNTLADLEGIRAVMILINGQEVETLAGHIYIGEPLAPDYSYLEDNQYK